MKKISSVEKKFLISQIAVIVLSILRVAKWEKVEHAARLMILDDYYLSLIMTFVMFIALFVLSMVVLKSVDDIDTNKVFYIIMMISIMLYPTYVHDNYLGAMDIYGLIFAVISLIFIIANKAVWISIIMMSIAMFINPMCIFSVGLVVPLAVLYKGIIKKENRHLIICIILSLFEIGTFLVSYKLGMLRVDAQQIIDIKKFIVILVLLLPYIICAIIMYYNLIKKNKEVTHKIYYILASLVGVPGFVVWAVAGDYTRAIVNLFLCYGMYLLVLITNRDKILTEQINSLCEVIKKWVPINAVVIIYIAAIMLFWICGVEEVDTEKLIELVVK